jgi:hypothetical protein
VSFCNSISSETFIGKAKQAYNDNGNSDRGKMGNILGMRGV